MRHHPHFLNEMVLLTTARLRDKVPAISAAHLYAHLRRVGEDIAVERDVTTFNAMLSGLKGTKKAGKAAAIGEEELRVAHIVFQDMVKEGVTPDHFTMSTLFHMCGSARSLSFTDAFLNKAKTLFAFEPNVVSGTALANAYAKCGELGRVEHVVHEMRSRGLLLNEWTYGAMISVYNQKKLHNRVKQCFHEAVESASVRVNQFLVSGMLASCLRERDVHFVRGVYEIMERESVIPTDELLFTMLETAVRGADIALGIEVLFHWAPKHGVLAVTPQMCAKLIAAGKQAQTTAQHTAADVRKVVARMTDAGVAPTVGVLNALISTYVRLGLHSEARRVLEEDFGRYGMTPDVVTYNTLIHGLGTSNRPELAMKVVQVMRKRGVEPNATTYNVMVDLLLERKHLGLATLMAEDLGTREWGESKGMTVSAQLKLLRASKKGGHALDLYRECVRREVELDSTSYGVLLCTLFECGMESEAMGIIGRLFVNKAVTCGIANVVMEQWSRRDGCAERCLVLLEKMKRCRVAPDEITYTTLIKALSRASLVDRAFRLLGEMQDVGIGMGDTRVWSALIDACSKNGQWERGFEVLQSMRMGSEDGMVPEPSVECYNSGLYGAGMNGEWETVVEIWKMAREKETWDGVTLSVMGSCVLKNRFKIEEWGVVREVYEGMNEWMQGEKRSKTEIRKVVKKMGRLRWLLEVSVEGKRLKRGAGGKGGGVEGEIEEEGEEEGEEE